MKIIKIEKWDLLNVLASEPGDMQSKTYLDIDEGVTQSIYEEADLRMEEVLEDFDIDEDFKEVDPEKFISIIEENSYAKEEVSKHPDRFILLPTPEPRPRKEWDDEYIRRTIDGAVKAAQARGVEIQVVDPNH